MMVVIDDYSRYPVIEILSKISAKAVLPKLDSVFALFGIPANYLGFKHRKITQLWPQANGEAERFMKTIGKAKRAAHSEHQNWKQELYNFLRNFKKLL